MLPIGAMMNAGAILLGGGIGMLVGRRMPEAVRACIFQGLGLSVLAVGIKLTLQTTSPLILITSIVCGGAVGGLLRVEDKMTAASLWVKAKLRAKNPRFADGLVLSVTVFCFGSLAVLGPLDEGVRGDLMLLSTKSFLDGLTTIAFASVYGVGALLSFVPVLVYEGSLTMLASSLARFIDPATVTELSAVAGVMTIGTAINLLELRRISLPNLLPSLVFTVVLASCFR
jgi:uncharacterized membrane protein YqgA involved in biofilm formation